MTPKTVDFSNNCRKHSYSFLENIHADNCLRFAITHAHTHTH